jgi:hypothetical protein
MADPVVDTPGNPPDTAPPVTGTGDWFESLPPDLKVEKSIQSFKGKGVADVAKSYVEAQKMIGGSIRLPKPDAKPEEREAFMADLSTKLGRPATAADYKNAVTLEALPDGTPWDEAAYDEFLGEMHKAHATPAQVNAAANAYRRILARGMAAQTQMYADTEKALKLEWGGTYDRKLTLASQAALEIGGKDYVALLESKGIANHPLVLKAHAAYGETLSEQKLISGDVPGQPTSNEAQGQIDAIYANREHPYWKLSVEKQTEMMYELTKQATGAKGRQVVATFG